MSEVPFQRDGQKWDAELVPPGLGSRLRRSVRRASATFWRDFLFFWTEYFPPIVLWTRPFFLWFAFRYSQVLADGPTRNARRLLGPNAKAEEIEKLRREVIRNGYLSVYELGRCLRIPPDQLPSCIDRADGTHHYHAARALRRGAILVSAHLGPFELGVAALRAHEPRIHVVFRRDERARFERIRSRFRTHLGILEAPVDEGLAVWMRLRDALLADEVVLMQGDRVMPGQKGVAVPFGNGHLLMPTGPVRLAMATGAPIVPLFSIRTAPCRVRLVIDEYVTAEREPGPVSGQHPVMRYLAQCIERQVFANPQQWITYYRAWLEDADAAFTPPAPAL